MLRRLLQLLCSALGVLCTGGLLLFPGEVSAQCTDPQADILLEIAESLNVDFLRWGEGALACEVCYWRGIDCDDQGNVISIDIQDNRLDGVIPEMINQLPKLKTISLRGNLSGPIPDGITQLPELENLNLSQNDFNSTIPSGIGNLSNLRELDLSGSGVNGAIPSSIGNLSNLETLNLDGTNLSGTLPNTIGGLRNLKSFNLSSSQITGPIPSALGDMTNLEFLRFGNANFNSSLPESIGNLKQLKELWLIGSNLTGSLPASIGGCESLEQINTFNNKFSGSLPSTIGQLNSLRIFYLINEGFSGPIPPQIGDCNNLLEINFQNTHFTSLPNTIGELHNLKFLSIINNELSGELPEEIGGLGGLTDLYLSGNNLSGAIPASFGNLTNLWNLALQRNNLSGCFPEELSALCARISSGFEGNCFYQSWEDFCSGEQCQGLIVTEENQVCEGSSITLEAASLGFDYLWSTGETTQEITEFPAENTQYILNGTTTTGCNVFDTIDIIVLEEASVNLSENICQGSTIYIGQEEFSSSGSYTRVLTASNGCDSTVNLELTVFPAPEQEIQRQICPGEEVVIGGQSFTDNGYYDITLQTIKGCDSIIHLDLMILDQEEIHINKELCDGNSYAIGNETFTASGEYTVFIDEGNDCQTVVYLDLLVKPSYKITFTERICQGSGYEFNGEYLTEPGLYIESLRSLNGCDSIVSLLLKVDPAEEFYLQKSICPGGYYKFDDMLIMEPGTYYSTFTASDGCDSIVRLDLEIMTPDTISIDTTLCEGEILDIQGQQFAAAGSYTTLLDNGNACNDVAMIQLSYNELVETNVIKEICPGEVLTYEGQEFTAGNYELSYQASNGCDSVVMLTVEESMTMEKEYDISICYGEEYEFHDQIFDQSGSYTVIITTDQGCEVSEILHLEVEEEIILDMEASICEGDTFYLENKSFTQSGTYYNRYISSAGCDSIVALQLTVNQSVETNLNINLCPGESFGINDEELVNSGIYTYVYSAANGCDSTVIVDLFVAKEENNTIEETICFGESYLLGGQEFNASGDYKITLDNECNSEVSLQLTVLPQIESSLDVVLCSGETENINGITYDSPGTYEQILTSQSGCDSLLKININEDVVGNITITGGSALCQGSTTTLEAQGDFDTWQWNSGSVDAAIQVSEPGVYEVTGINANGCATTSSIIVENIDISIEDIITVDNESCSDAQGQIEIITGNNPNELVYSIDGGQSWQNTPIFSNLKGGSYQVVVRNEDMSCEVAASTATLINDKMPINGSISVVHPLVCPGDQNAEVYLSIMSMFDTEYSVTWSDGTRGRSNNHLGAGYHTAKVEDGTGCISFFEVEIEEPNPISYTSSLRDTTLCNGDSALIIMEDSALDYTWYGPDGYMYDDAEARLEKSGQYIVEISDYRGCQVRDTINIASIYEDFSGVDFLLGSEGVMGEVITAIDVSWPLPDVIQWEIPEENIEVIDIVGNQALLEFKEEGLYDISMLATIGECSLPITKTIHIVDSSAELQNQDQYANSFPGKINDVTLYPNPNNGVFNLKITMAEQSTALVNIVDQVGNVLKSQTMTGDNLYLTEEDISFLPPGVYAVIVQSDADVRYQTFSKQ